MDERRIDLRPWQNLDQLKEAYEKYISPDKIDKIISEITKLKKFKKRATLTEEENKECFLNLVDSNVYYELFHKKETFLKRMIKWFQ